MRVLVVYNANNASAIDASVMLSAYFASQGIECVLTASRDKEHDSLGAFDLAVALGGDGTMLRTAHLLVNQDCPILGINYGHLGFLANENEGSVVAAVAAALSGDAIAQERTNLRVDVLCEGDDEDAFEHGLLGEPDDAPRAFFALNEAAITRGAAGYIIDFGLGVGGASIAQIRGDGIVVASATGSTAYALSAGGPLVAPGFKGLVVVPVAPHSLKSRAIVTDPNDVVEVTMGDELADREAVLFLDGELIELPAPIERVCVRRGPVPTTLLRYNHKGFYAHASEVFF